jgi:glycosyltransferase involved in cell wall biosynthesis
MRVVLSIVTPAFNEAVNLDALYARLARSMEQLAMDWEWLVVDDHSPDDTFGVTQRLSDTDGRVRGIRLARNSGSHVAITCGLHHAKGDAAVVMAADLQDPPETLPAMVNAWRGDAQIVWAARRTRPSTFAVLYYQIMRRVVGLHEMPAYGADFFLVDRVVLDAFRQFPEGNISVLALITWTGFRQVQVEYDKEPRAEGQSGWTLGRKLRLVMDSVAAFSNLPIRMCWYAGVVFLVAAFAAGGGAVLLWPSVGAGNLLVLAVILGSTSVQLLALGVVGQYVWRALEESRRRPQYLVERRTDVQANTVAPRT